MSEGSHRWDEKRRVAIRKAEAKSTKYQIIVLGLPENMHCKMIHAIDVASIGRRKESSGEGTLFSIKY